MNWRVDRFNLVLVVLICAYLVLFVCDLKDIFWFDLRMNDRNCRGVFDGMTCFIICFFVIFIGNMVS